MQKLNVESIKVICQAGGGEFSPAALEEIKKIESGEITFMNMITRCKERIEALKKTNPELFYKVN
ncbi:MAG: hypothetical protein ACI3ZR_06040 [bacterium]